MSALYASSPVAIRGDLAAAHDRAWERIARPGTWWDGAQRVRIAAETRHASSCRLCPRRKEAPSPAAIEGTHDSLGELSEVVVEVVHRVRNDPRSPQRTVVSRRHRRRSQRRAVCRDRQRRRPCRGGRHDGARLGSRRAAVAASASGCAVATPPCGGETGRRMGPVAPACRFERRRSGPLPDRPARRKHHESDEPRA